MDLMTDPELVELVELEIRDLLCHNDFDGENIPIIQGSARAALQGDTYVFSSFLYWASEKKRQFALSFNRCVRFTMCWQQRSIWRNRNTEAYGDMRQLFSRPRA